MKIRDKSELNYSADDCEFILLFDDGREATTWSCEDVDQVIDFLERFTKHMSQEEFKNCRAYMIVKLTNWTKNVQVLFPENLLEEE